MNRNSIIEIIKTYLEEPDINILPGDPVVISELLLPCSNNNNSSSEAPQPIVHAMANQKVEICFTKLI